MQERNGVFYRLLPLLLLIFIDSFAYFLVIPVLIHLFYDVKTGLLSQHTALDTRNILTGITISLSPLATILAAPLMGNLSDLYGRKKTLLMCLGFVMLGLLLPIMGILQKNITLILVGRFMAGIGSASQSVAQAAVADVCRDKNKAYFLSLIAFMMTLALILGPLAGAYLTDPSVVSWFTTKTPYEFALLLSVLNVFLLTFFFHETLKNESDTLFFGVRYMIREVPALLKSHRVGLLLFVFLFMELGWSQYYQSISLFLHIKLHFGVDKISVFTSFMGLAMCVGLLVIYPILLKFISVKNILRGSVLLLLLSLTLCAIFSFNSAQWLLSSLVALCVGCSYVSLVAIISNKTTQNHQGLVMGYLSTLLYFAWMLTAFDGGFLISWYSKLPIFLSVIFLMIASFGLFSSIENNK